MSHLRDEIIVAHRLSILHDPYNTGLSPHQLTPIHLSKEFDLTST